MNTINYHGTALWIDLIQLHSTTALCWLPDDKEKIGRELLQTFYVVCVRIKSFQFWNWSYQNNRNRQGQGLFIIIIPKLWRSGVNLWLNRNINWAYHWLYSILSQCLLGNMLLIINSLWVRTISPSNVIQSTWLCGPHSSVTPCRTRVLSHDTIRDKITLPGFSDL